MGLRHGGRLRLRAVARGRTGRAQRRLTWIGLGLTLGFVALRATSWYGDPCPWESPHAVLSFINTNKYPPSLLFLYYILHVYLIYAPALLLAFIVTGSFETHLFDLWVVYAVWLFVIAALYPVCRRDAWLHGSTTSRGALARLHTVVITWE